MIANYIKIKVPESIIKASKMSIRSLAIASQSPHGFGNPRITYSNTL